MGWEKRGNRDYYYRKWRIDGRVVSEYLGRGELAHIAAQLDSLDRQEVQMERESFIKEQDAQRKIEQDIDWLEEHVRAIAKAHLLIASCHTHKGQWRRKRGGRR